MFGMPSTPVSTAELVLRLDGKEDGRISLKPIRSYGNGRVYLGGCDPAMKPYKGCLDELVVEGLPQELGSSVFDE